MQLCEQKEEIQTERFLIGKAFLVGLAGGAVSVFYRFLLGFSESGREWFISFCKTSLLRGLVWLFALAALAWIVCWFLKKEPLISGSGIPQVEGEFHGHFEANPLKVLFCKMAGGFLSIFGGLSLGREGPSIQLGAMSAKLLSKKACRCENEKNILLLCGAAAGLSAAFNAPLAGVLFVIEEIYKKISPALVFSVMVSSVTADFLSKLFFGMNPVFSFSVSAGVSLKHYWVLLLLGIFLGISGTVYNKVLLFSQRLYSKVKRQYLKLLIPFVLAAILAFSLPGLLGGGHHMIELLEDGGLHIWVIFLFLVMKFFFSVVSFGSGAPGGIFFPLLVMGAYLGGGFLTLFTGINLLPDLWLSQFMIFAMAGFFTAVVGAPITGMILICEMTGQGQILLPMGVVCAVSYFVSAKLRNRPIYDSLLERMLSK